MDWMVLARASGRIRPDAQARDARTVRRDDCRSDRRLAGSTGPGNQAASARHDADTVSVFRLNDADQKDVRDRRRTSDAPPGVWNASRFSETGTGFACAKLSEILPSARVGRFVRMTCERRADDGALAVALAADHVDHAERRDDVRDHPAYQHLVQRAHAEEAWRPHSHAIRAPAAVAHDV